jgi:Holliday junction resolvase RusA-like endonuclease
MEDVIRMELAIRPPTVTHHAKKIVRYGRNGRLGLTDSPDLKAARTLYLATIPHNPGRPVRPPVGLKVLFVWDCAGLDCNTIWNVAKPDLDNSVKALLDALVLRGWIERDQQVTNMLLSKMLYNRGGIVLSIRSLATGFLPPRPNLRGDTHVRVFPSWTDLILEEVTG